jgi:lycopene cyclase domain-containing protein
MQLNNFYYLFFHILVLGSILVAKLFYRSMHLPAKLMLRVLPVAALFIINDALVTNHWWFFNDLYVLPLPKIFELPIEEILFFITVPFGLLTFLENLPLLNWQNLSQKAWQIKNRLWLFILYLVFAILLLFVLSQSWWYSASILLLMLILLKDLLNLSKAEFLALLFTVFMTLIFNYYLTALPIVTYNPIYKSGLMILTIPLEDFIYGMIFYLLILKSVYGKKTINFS